MKCCVVKELNGTKVILLFKKKIEKNVNNYEAMSL